MPFKYKEAEGEFVMQFDKKQNKKNVAIKKTQC
jgi:hypothetical protein